MEKFKEEYLPAKTVRRLDYTTCDLCGITAEEDTGEKDRKYFDTELKYYSETKFLICDVCSKCFLTKVLIALDGIGLKLRVETE